MESTAALLKDHGLAAVVLVIIFTLVLPALKQISDRLTDVILTNVLILTSLPEVKARAKEEAERIRAKLSK